MLESLDPAVAAPLHVMLQPAGAVPATSLLIATIELSSMLGLQMPNVNGPLLLYKACCELALPEVSMEDCWSRTRHGGAVQKHSVDNLCKPSGLA